MKLTFSHPTGNANSRAVVMGVLNAGLLFEFHTTVATFPLNIFDRISFFRGFSEFKRRSFSAELEPYTKSWPFYELGRFAAVKAGLSKLTRHEKDMFSIDAVYRNFDKRVAQSLKITPANAINAIYSYEDGALLSFREAKMQGLQCLYDLPIGYWRTARRLMSIERERWPDWIPTLTGFDDSAEKLNRKDEELRLADQIFVASRFTANSLMDFPGELAPVTIIPYGFPPVSDIRQYIPLKRRALKILFVGSLSQRKGIADLFAAVKAIGKHVELTVVGRKVVANCAVLDEALARHTWIPSLPHAEILKLMREHDVLVFPSLFEGFGLVITEAMSQGTPVITTERTAGPELIVNQENGWLINAASTEALQKAIEDILYKPNLIEEFGRAAMKSAGKRPWNIYGHELSQAILKKAIKSDS
jgi:glycosyltransferase involved in cell wall biosynthesis